MTKHKAVLDRIAGYQLANYLHAIGDDPRSSGVPSGSVHGGAHEHLRERRQVLSHLSVFHLSQELTSQWPAQNWTHSSLGPGGSSVHV